MFNSLKCLALKNPISGLNKIFDNRIRLGVMSILMVNEEMNFNDLKQMLEVTDGNLATHLLNLEENGFIKVFKGFVGKKTNTTAAIATDSITKKPRAKIPATTRLSFRARVKPGDNTGVRLMVSLMQSSPGMTHSVSQ